VDDHEDRAADRVPTAPRFRDVEGAAPADQGADAAHHLTQQSGARFFGLEAPLLGG
jgi:hypothetical protein